MIVAEVFIQLINAAFLLILLIYMEKEGYHDHESAQYIKYRFLSVLIISFPLGIFIRNRKIKPLFYIAGFGVPISALLIIHAVSEHIDWLIYAAQITWGVAFTCLQVTALPFILRNARKDTHTEAISLSYSTWSFAGIIAGILIFSFRNINPGLFDEKLILQLLAIVGFCSLFFIARIKVKETVETDPNKRFAFGDYDYSLIFKVMVPTLLIAIGAGLTIPFISLFFFKIHGVDSDQFSLIGSVALIVVFASVVFVPAIKQKMGYKRAIPTTQSMAILMLIGLATTEMYQLSPWAVYIAILCYILRQPLMNLAGPMTSDLTMKYVGKKNQEIVSALIAAIWNGSWFVSAGVFEYLRESNIAYMHIFLITAGLYMIGVIWYYLLILDFEKRERLGLIED